MTVTLSASTAEGLASQLVVALSHLVVDSNAVINSVNNGYLTGLTEKEAKQIEQTVGFFRRGEAALNQRISDIEKASQKLEKAKTEVKVEPEKTNPDVGSQPTEKWDRDDVDALVFDAIQKGLKNGVAKLLRKHQVRTVEFLPESDYADFCEEMCELLKEV